MPDLSLWIRNESHPPGREVKLYLPDDAHVADMAAKAADMLKFDGEKKLQVELVVRNADGELLPMMMRVAEIANDAVSLIGLSDDAQFANPSWARADSYAPEVSGAPVGSPGLAGVLPKSKTSYGYDFVEDEDADILGSAPEKRKSNLADSSARKRAAAVSDEDVGARSNSWSGALEEGEDGDSGMPARGATRTWAGAGEEAGGFDGMPKRSQTCEIIGAEEDDEDEEEEKTIIVEEPVKIEDRFCTSASRRPKEDKREVSFQKSSLTQSKQPTQPTQPTQPVQPSKYQQQQPQQAVSTRHVQAVYVDRIPPDTSDAMIRTAINTQLSPKTGDNVVSLEVIRNQKTRHCHAFAFLTFVPPPGITSLSLPGTTEQIRVQSSEKERSVPKEVPARSTLHVRMYARRKGWVVGVTKMMWRGFLAMMEDTCKGITDCITIIADDRSRKNLQVHKSICLCAFFVECRSVAKAQAFRSMVHDKRTVNDDGGIFLIQCDYTLSNKKLHDTCKNKDSLVRNYNQELRAAKQFAERGGVRHWPQDATSYFEMSDRQNAEWGSDEEEEGDWRPPTAMSQRKGQNGDSNGNKGSKDGKGYRNNQGRQQQYGNGNPNLPQDAHHTLPNMRGMASLGNLGGLGGMGMGMGMNTFGDPVRNAQMLQQQQQVAYMTMLGLQGNAGFSGVPLNGGFPNADADKFHPFFSDNTLMGVDWSKQGGHNQYDQYKDSR